MRLVRGYLPFIAGIWACADVAVHHDINANRPICTAAGCSDGVSVKLQSREDNWKNGSYAFEFSFSNRTYLCATDIPAGLSTSPTVPSRLPCSPDLRAHFLVESHCDMVSNRGTATTGCHMTVGNVLSLLIDETPDVFAIRVKRDDNAIFYREVTPTYHEIAPNGETCEPICSVGVLNLVIDE